MLIVGDIHGQFESYRRLLAHYKGEPSVQIGDFGIGFPGDKPLPKLPEDAVFIRGNHDNPTTAANCPHYLGDYGIEEMDGIQFFFLSGARSADHPGVKFYDAFGRDVSRIEGFDWWPGEELSLEDLEDAIELYRDIKPEVVLTHDGPDVATDEILRVKLLHKGRIPSRTANALNRMYEIHQPLLWIFGHWHVNFRQQIGRTEFRCLPPMGWCEIRKEQRRFRKPEETEP